MIEEEIDSRDHLCYNGFMSTNDLGSALWQKEPPPIKSDSPASWDLVLADLKQIQFHDLGQERVKELLIEDIHLRDATGEKKYGVRLQPNNGRNSVKDAYEEALDGLVYLRTAIAERATCLVKTPDTEMTLAALGQMYKAQLQIALGLRFILKLDKESNVATIDTRDGRGPKEPGQHQSNIIVP